MKNQGSNQEKRRLQVLIVDDHPLIREGLTKALNSEPDIRICGMVGDAAGALRCLEECCPDVAVVDLSLPNPTGLDLIRDMKNRRPRLSVLVLSIQDESLYAERALRAGALGYVMKSAPVQRVVEGIRAVAAGRFFVSEEVADRIVGEVFASPVHAPSKDPIEKLSQREFQVFEFIGRGLCAKEIAAQLHLSVKTVETHRAHLKRKLGVTSTAELTRRAILWVEGLARPSAASSEEV